ncbi:MAG: VIT domain-containing protein [Lysobacterales bacterium]
MSIRLIGALACASLLLSVSAAALTPLPPPPPPPPPQVWIAPGSGLQPIRLADVDIQIRTRGFVALTTLDLRFDNPNARVLEGEFVFPLAAGQTVSGYALEVNGAMREGVVVDKQTARVAFEDTSRQRIDPGLAEITAGNVFRTRLYPIPAQGSKRVRLHLVATMAEVGQAWRYRLPMQFAAPVDRLHVRAEALLAESAPIPDALSADNPLKFEQSQAAWISEFTREHIRPERELAFQVPRSAGPAQIEAADPLDPAWRSVIAITDSGRPNQLATGKPKRIALYYDASASAQQRQREREQAALAAYLKSLGEVEVVLVAFRNDADAPALFPIHHGDASALLAAIAALPLDGGSSYGAIDLLRVGKVDQILIVGDGLSNFGPSEPQLQGPAGQRPPVHVLLAAQQADHARLTRLARAGGGLVIDLADTAPETAATLLGQRSWRLLEAKARKGECRSISPAAPTPVEARLTLSAQCRGRSELVLRFGDGSGQRVERVIQTGSEPLPTPELAHSVHQLWAQAWIAELNAAPVPDEAAINALGKRYSVVTSGTSLLVLDRIEDYVRYRVEPREPALAAEYRRLIEAQPKLAVDPDKQARIESLRQRWQEFRDYHAAQYPGVETVLVPMAQAELAAWPDIDDKAWKAGRQDAAALAKRAEALAASWLSEAADEAARPRWEREAASVVLAIEALRARRAALPAVAGPVDANASARADAISGRDDAPVVGEAAPEAELARPAPSPPPMPASAAPAAPAEPAMVAGSVAERAGAAREEAKQDGDASPAVAQNEVSTLKASIELSGWNPDAPYLADIRAARDPYAAYLAARDQYAGTPTYFMDVADYLRGEARQPRLALRVLSNLAELDTENTALIRVLAYRLSQWEEHALAVPLFERALRQRGEEPQSYRDLALALARQDTPDRQRAVELLWQVATGEWHGRFPDIELIVLHELNDILARAKAGEVDLSKLAIDPRLLDPVAVGLRVVLSWDADNTDIDLWVVDPSGDKAVYSQPRTRTGGHMSRDFTGGYGPEVYTIRRPLPGTYVVLANYFGDRRQSLTGPVTVQLEFQTRFGTADSERVATTRRLESGSQTIEIGRFKVGS